MMGGPPEVEQDQPFMSVVGLIAGGVTTVVLVLIDLTLSFNGLIGIRSEWVSILGMAIASFTGALVLAKITDKRWAHIAFILVGAALFGLLLLVAAAMSDGHPDHAIDPLPLYHIIASGIAFYVMSGSAERRKTRWRIAIISVACFALAALIYGRIDAARHTRMAHEEAQRQMGVMETKVLPRVFATSPRVNWTEPTYANYMFAVHGSSQRPSRSIDLHGYEYGTTCLMQFRASEPFVPLMNKSLDAQWLHLRTYLKSQGFRDELLHSRRANDSSSVKCAVDAVPFEPNLGQSRGEWDMDVAISVVGDKVFVNMNRSLYIPPPPD